MAAGALALAACLARGQEPHPSDNSSPTRAAANEPVTPAAITGSKQDPAAVARGAEAFKTNCSGCHGVAAKGGPGAPDLMRSLSCWMTKKEF